jgi:SAM-dependent methyltransferase
MKNALEYNWSSVSNDLNPERRALLDKYLSGNRILDAGCGGGSYVAYLISKGFDCLGIDNFKEFVNFANENAVKGKVFQGDITALPFPDKSFDCSYCLDVFEHVDDYSSLSELERVTTKRIIIAVPKTDSFFKKYNLTFLHYQDKSHLRTYDEGMLRDLIMSIPHKSAVIINELAVPQRSFVNEIINKSLQENHGRINRYILSMLLRLITARIKFRPIYTGLVAIIDLA